MDLFSQILTWAVLILFILSFLVLFYVDLISKKLAKRINNDPEIISQVFNDSTCPISFRKRINWLKKNKDKAKDDIALNISKVLKVHYIYNIIVGVIILLLVVAFLSGTMEKP